MTAPASRSPAPPVKEWVIAYDENEAAEPRGILHWLGTGAGAKEWSNPATDGLVDIRANVRHFTGGEMVTEWASVPLVATNFASEDDCELMLECRIEASLSEAFEVDLKRSVLVTGISFQGNPPTQGQTLILLGSNDGASWQELHR